MKPSGYLIKPPRSVDSTGPMFVPAESELAEQARNQGWVVTPVYEVPALAVGATERRIVARRIAVATLENVVGPRGYDITMVVNATDAAIEVMDEIDREGW